MFFEIVWAAKSFGPRRYSSSAGMSSFIRTSDLASREMVAKLINAGYLKPAQRNDADAITNAIAQMKENLRGGGRQVSPRQRSSKRVVT
jgi:hypothetical protein